MLERDFDYEMMRGDAMLDELSKLAAGATGLAKYLTTINKGRLAGAGIGAGIGAAGGAAAEPEDRAGGALRGALLGGAGGLAAGQLATRAGRQQVAAVGRRQLHGLTGYVHRTPEQMARGVSWTGKGMSKAERVKTLERMGLDVGEHAKNPAKAIQQALEQQSVTKALPMGVRKVLAKHEVMGAAARRRAAEEGLTSIPGVVKGMVRNPLQTLKTGFKSQGPAGMMLATVPTAMMVPGMVSGQGYGQEYSGPGGGGKFIGENLGYAALGAVPLAPMLGGAMLAGKAGEWATKKIRGAGRVQPQEQVE